TWSSASPFTVLMARANSLKAEALIRCTAKPSATPTAMANAATMTRAGCAPHSPAIIQRAAIGLMRLCSAFMAGDQTMGGGEQGSVRKRRGGRGERGQHGA